MLQLCKHTLYEHTWYTVEILCIYESVQGLSLLMKIINLLSSEASLTVSGTFGKTVCAGR